MGAEGEPKMKRTLFFLIVLTTYFFMFSAGCSPPGGGGGGGGGSSYSVTVDGVPVPVQRVSKFDEPVNYVNFSFAGACEIAVTLSQSFSTYKLSPESKGITPARNGNTLTFTAVEPSYLVLLVDSNEPLFLLIDPAEVDPPLPGDPDVKNIMDYGVDNTGATVETDTIQAAIDDASGAVQNILYFPPGTYATKSLFLKDNMTLYLAEGAVLACATEPAELLSHPVELARIEWCSRALIHMNGVTNAHLAGRGLLDGNGRYLKSTNKKMFLIKIEESSDCSVEGVIARDSCFWNTIIYRSDSISITNFKVINNRLSSEWNETDGVDFDNSTNGTLYNAFLYTGDDSMAVKSDDIPDGDPEYDGEYDPTSGAYISVDTITHEKIVCYSGSSGCKVGTKTMGPSMSDITFNDVDVIDCRRGLVIDNMDCATVENTVFSNIRIENITSGRIIDINIDVEDVFWRNALGIGTTLNTSITNVSSNINAECRLWGIIHDWDPEDPHYEEKYYINGVAFTNFTIQGKAVTALDDPDANFLTNAYVINVSF
jgi:hypothetical protein